LLDCPIAVDRAFDADERYAGFWFGVLAVAEGFGVEERREDFGRELRKDAIPRETPD
jgi:hypothetical protein